MKKVICNIEEDYNKYIILLNLIKIKGRTYRIIDKIPLSINKNSLSNKNEIKEFALMINKTLHKNKFSYSNCIISLNSFKIIRDEFTYPKISLNELKKVINIEIIKRYGNDGIVYNKMDKIDNKIRNNVIIINKMLKKVIDELFDYINLKIKKVLFLPEAINKFIKNDVEETNYFFLYEGKDYYLINVSINSNVIYSEKIDKKEKIINKLLSIYGYYSNKLNGKIYISCMSNNELDCVKALELSKSYIYPNKIIEIDSLINRYVTNEYEKL